MDKFVLIDGNSLLNRAFYAISPFSTKDGLMTNAIFGFVKFILKIAEEESPRYLAVAFDLPAPTFRHKMYEGYKATRTPMPDGLKEQIAPLKNLLKEMNICIVEKEGYEADDLIGTLSCAFENLSVLIYTGDRDSYQLVRENVTVCFTKRGVSDTEKLTNDNFFEKIGLYPHQIIEEKALMGDSSDNIPGVRGIGPKTALDLLTKYQTAENVFLHRGELSSALQKKLEGQEEISRLSHTLATIDKSVPLSVSKEECAFTYPLPAGAKAAFAALEFRSLLNDKYFDNTPSPHPKRARQVTFSRLSDLGDAQKILEGAKIIALSFEEDGLHLGLPAGEFLLPYKRNLLEEGFFFEELYPLLGKIFSGNVPVLLSDSKAAFKFLGERGIPVRCPVEDVSLLLYVSNSNNRPATPKDLARELGLEEKFCAAALLLAFEEARCRTSEQEEKIYREVELPLSRVLYEMEETGVRVDENSFPALSKEYAGEVDSLTQKIYDLAGESFNISSPVQLGYILFEKMGLKPKNAKKNNRGGYSTSADVLEKLAEDNEIVRLILKYREVKKLQSTYIDGFRPLIKGGLVHTTYHQTMTTTGRLSSSDPNLQNIPVRTERGRALRKLFIAREGNVLVDADYSQIELRLLAHFSGCGPLKRAYLENADIHALTASQVFGVPIEEVTPLMRRRAKAVNFGIIYGISAFGLAQDIDCSTKEAQRYIDSYFATYTDVKEYMDENVERARRDGFVTTILGRKRYISEIKSPNFSVRSFGERAAMNMPLQGSAADIIKLAMLGVDKRLKKEHLRAKMVLQVHDELVLDAPKEELEIAQKILKEEMESAVSLSVPLIVDVHFGGSWYDAK